MRRQPSGVGAAMASVRSRPGRRCVQGAGRITTPGARSTGSELVIARRFAGASEAMRRHSSVAARLSWLPGSSTQVMSASAAIARKAWRRVSGAGVSASKVSPASSTTPALPSRAACASRAMAPWRASRRRLRIPSG